MFGRLIERDDRDSDLQRFAQVSHNQEVRTVHESIVICLSSIGYPWPICSVSMCSDEQ